jgi:hypothetical protein
MKTGDFFGTAGTFLLAFFVGMILWQFVLEGFISGVVGGKPAGK